MNRAGHPTLDENVYVATDEDNRVEYVVDDSRVLSHTPRQRRYSQQFNSSAFANQLGGNDLVFDRQESLRLKQPRITTQEEFVD